MGADVRTRREDVVYRYGDTEKREGKKDRRNGTKARARRYASPFPARAETADHEARAHSSWPVLKQLAQVRCRSGTDVSGPCPFGA